METVVTRFAPSPTGFLHIGGARTALFNKVFSKAYGGKFLLRIEDTDKARSTDAAVDAILNGLKWLGLDWDDEIVFQSHNLAQHREVVEELLDSGKAYRCYLTIDDMAALRQHDAHTKISSPWRDNTKPAPKGAAFSVRLRVDETKRTTIFDTVQGEVSVDNNQLDDLVLLRSDGTPTYMLAVIVDDHNMGITHVIRGDDHLTNTFRQLQIYKALDWPSPQYAHIPLIHGPDGSKLSKRHGALGIEEYQRMGYLPEAIRSYLLRLGWSYESDMPIDIEEASKIFKLEDVGKSPARLDFDKLNSINAYYLNKKDNEELISDALLAIKQHGNTIIEQRLRSAMQDIKSRSKTLIDIAEMAQLYVQKQQVPDQKSMDILSDYNPELLEQIIIVMNTANSWSVDDIKSIYDNLAKEHGIKIGLIMMYLRAFLLGNFNTPGIWNVMMSLGKEESLKRIKESKKSYPART